LRLNFNIQEIKLGHFECLKLHQGPRDKKTYLRGGGILRPRLGAAFRRQSRSVRCLRDSGEAGRDGGVGGSVGGGSRC